MNIFSKFFALLKIERALKEADMDKVKAGVKTSEFWLAVLSGLLMAGNQHLGLNLPAEAILGIAGTVMSYIFSRSAVKKR